jgi:hypothetical protein
MHDTHEATVGLNYKYMNRSDQLILTHSAIDLIVLRKLIIFTVIVAIFHFLLQVSSFQPACPVRSKRHDPAGGKCNLYS